jgi:hypothetical protein
MGGQAAKKRGDVGNSEQKGQAFSISHLSFFIWGKGDGSARSGQGKIKRGADDEGQTNVNKQRKKSTKAPSALNQK